MDNALFSLLFFFFVQISAGVAPMRWPQCKWLAGVIFWISSAGAAACLIWYGYSQGWFSMAITMAGRQTFGILVLICGAGLGVLGLSIIAAGETTKTASIILQSDTYRFGETIYIESRSVLAPDGRDTKLYETNFFIVVSNALEDGRTLRSLQVEIRGYETPVIAPIRGNQPEKIDLKHGQAAFFQVGRIVRSHFFGNFVGTVTYDVNRLKSYEYNVASGKPKFEVWAFDNVYRYALHEEPPLPAGWKVIVLVSAEDRKSQQMILIVRPGDDKSPVAYSNGDAYGEEK